MHDCKKTLIKKHFSHYTVENFYCVCAMKKFKNIVLLGAGSRIAREIIYLLAKESAEKFYFISRSDSANQECIVAVKAINSEILCNSVVYDYTDPRSLTGLVERLDPKTDQILTAVGKLIASSEQDPVQLEETIKVNFTYPALFVNEFINRIYKENSCSHYLTVGFISSVAGERVRGSNYCYGASKRGLSGFADGLRVYCEQNNLKVRICVIKPGLVNTPMIRDRKDRRLIAEPDSIAPGIVKNLKYGTRNIYSPGYWGALMDLIKLMPYLLFKKIRS